jgi:membrane protein implicated in regulation of membrane protease activity
MDWKSVLKIAGPSAIAAWVFVELINSYLSTSEIFKTNMYLNFVLLIIIFSFCVIMGWLWIRSSNEKNKVEPTENEIEKNEICDNEVGNDLSVGSIDTSIVDNKISNNKVQGSINIGSK